MRNIKPRMLEIAMIISCIFIIITVLVACGFAIDALIGELCDSGLKGIVETVWNGQANE